MTAYVLMTALPPTKGHLRLMEFASRIDRRAKILVCTQPDEPFADTRYFSLLAAAKNRNLVATVRQIHETVNQDPSSPGFWDYWRNKLQEHGAKPGDIVVSSEAYGKRLAEEIQGKFFPYDPERDIYKISASQVRADPARYMWAVLPEFQPYLQMKVTFFGAESTGKTTLSKRLAQAMNAWWTMEWARPYLELNGAPPITTEVMTDIWHGQRALQDQSDNFKDKPYVFQDTDLFSTVGYWDFWDMNTPRQLKDQAIARKSDLYLITQSNIPFEQDPIRYGGEKRESDDQYWIDLCKRYQLNYRVLQADSLAERMQEAGSIIKSEYKRLYADRLQYERFANDGTWRQQADEALKNWQQILTLR